jgi:ribulose-bisphosphate carboxylase large chain
MLETISHNWIDSERFQVTYHIAAVGNAARQIAENICLEQTVEVTRSVIPSEPIGSWILGHIESLKNISDHSSEAIISYPAAITAWELPQLLNVILGNTSLTPGVRVDNIELSPTILAAFKGPRFGIAGLRKLIGASLRPILATAIKPMGLTASALAKKAYAMAVGGLDIIKDDHGLTNQPFGLFAERISIVSAAVRKANNETGGNTLYMANITAPIEQIWERARFAKREGASGFLICPGLVGFDTMRAIADDDSLALPILSHPSLLGAFVASPEHGIAHGALFGSIMRLAGADASVFTNYGGRFSFSISECCSIAEACKVQLGNIATIFPVPAGGMTLEKIPDLHATYGIDVMYLIGGALMAHSPDLVANCQLFRKLVEQELKTAS